MARPGMSRNFGFRKGLGGLPRRLREIGKRIPMKRTIIVGVLVALVAAIAVAVWYFLFREDSKPAPVQAPVPVEKVRPPPPVTPVPAATLPPVVPVTPAPKPATPMPKTATVPQTQYVRKPAPQAAHAPAPRVTRVATGPCLPGDTGRVFNWRVSGADPYARSEEEAFSDAKLDRMLFCFKVPKADWAEIKRQLRNPENGRLVTLKPGDRVGEMMFGNGKMIDNVIVQIPGGQRALHFRVNAGGTAYEFLLPLGCWNWTRPPPPPCVTLTFDHKYPEGGKVRWGVGTATGPLKDHVCNAQRQGNGPWKDWYGRCDDCVPGERQVRFLRRVLGGSAQWVQRRIYDTTHRRQTLRFSEEVWTKVLYLCQEAADGSETCGVYMRPEDWKGRHHVTVSNSLWLRNEGNCPD